MNKTSLLMLIVGTILGIVIGYVTFSAKPKPPEFNIQAEGFRKITFDPKLSKFNIEVLKRVDADNLEVSKNIQVPAEGFLKGYSAMDQLVKKMVADGKLAPGVDAGNSSNALIEE